MRRGWFFVFLIVLFSTVLHIPITRSTETVRITTGDWPPYLDKDLPGGGFLARIIRESFAIEGIEVRFSYFPWSRALALVHSPDYETSAVWSCTEDRSREFVFSAALIPYGWYFYYRAGQHFDWETLTDLQGMTVGLTQDYSYGETLADVIKSGLVYGDVTTSDLANLKKLLLGRIDLFPMDPVVGETMIMQQLGPVAASRLTFHPKPVRTAFFRLPFSRNDEKSARLIQAFNKGLASLRESGRYKAIIDEALEAFSSPKAEAILRERLASWEEHPGPCD